MSSSSDYNLYLPMDIIFDILNRLPVKSLTLPSSPPTSSTTAPPPQVPLLSPSNTVPPPPSLCYNLKTLTIWSTPFPTTLAIYT
ncbi:hypothetical protein CsSME_00011869 [Camellia sinensis var. sinensis]